jgi:2-polyprenyl-3-methyl-5-hydroxy-6-metoxy-1,4-benzoquinol methylase
MGLRFDRRSTGMEIMDDLQCSGEVVDQTLRELEFINRTLGGDGVTLDGVKTLLKKSAAKSVTIADLGCGGGDILMKISDWAKENRIAVQLIGIDANPHIIAFARANSARYPDIRYETLNILSPEFRTKTFDIVVATLFTHHFSDPELEEILRTFKTRTRIGMVINDIHRHPIAYFAIRWLTQIFSKSAMVRFDAPLSVLRAFTRADWQSVLNKAGIASYSLRWRWAFRWQVIIRF